MENRRSKKYIAWILAIAMAFTGLGINFSTVYATPGHHLECKKFNLEAYKVLEYKSLEAGDFEFEAYKADANGNPTGSVLATGQNDANGKITFPEIRVERDGIYRYVLKEVIPDDEDKIDGVVYDESSKLVTVKVLGNEYVQTISDVSKVEGNENVYKTSVGANYVVIKQATFAIVWTNGLLSPEQRAEIKKQVQIWDPSRINTFYYIHGEGTFLDAGDSRKDDLQHDIPHNAGPYTFSITSDSRIKLECSADKISHLDYGIYGEKPTFTNTFLEKGSIEVTKAVKLDGSDWTDFSGDFYAALFNDEALTDMAAGPEKIEVTNGVSSTVTFDDLDRKTYYLAETDADGDVISTGSVIDDKELTGISGTGAIALTELDGEESATITNDYTTIEGSLKVTKALDGESNSDAGSFWFMVYDEEEVAVTPDPLEITRNTDGTYNEVTVSDLPLGEYTIVETDSAGVAQTTDIVLFGMKLATITYSEQTVTLTADARDKNITITNTFEKIKGKIKVNKSITGAASGKEDFDETFYFGLFTKEGTEYTLVADSVISATSVNGADFEALFENVELGTYYVAETDEDGNVIEAGETRGQYKLAEVTGQYSEAVLTDNSTQPQVEVDIENNYEYISKIEVTKAVKLDGSDWTDFSGDFYAALFNDEALTDMAAGPEKIEVTNGVSSTVTFDDLDRKTYYLAETDADGDVISTGSVIDDKELTGISGTGAIALTELDGEESATITNDYTTIEGSLKVTKALDGESNSDAGSFWFMVYDEEEVAVTPDPLEITRNTDGTYNEVTVSDLPLGEYTIVETDSAGVAQTTDIVLFGMKLATITYSEQTVTLTADARDKNITITNTFEKIKGKIKVNKSITGAASGKEDFDETFYFGLFTKEGTEYTLVADSVISATSVNGADFEALFENVELGTYYVAETDEDGNVIEAGETRGQYKLAEVTGQYSEAVLTDNSTQPQVEVDIINNYEYFGKINVTKKIFLNDEEKQSYSDSFWVALFDESNQRYDDPKEITMTGGDANTVVFENLPFGDYVLYETDDQGNKLEGPESGRTPEWIDITYENNEVSLTEEGPSADVVVNNYFEDKDDPYFGSIEVTKKVTYNGEAAGTSLTFYTALFADKECKEIVTEVKALEMNGEDNVSVIFDKDKNGESLPADTVYYVAETDKDGNPITDPKGYTIQYENQQKVEMDVENDYVGKTTIVNQYEEKEKEFYYYDENGTKITTVKTSATSSETKTGDDINIGLLILLALIGVAGAITPFALRKREKEESDK